MTGKLQSVVNTHDAKIGFFGKIFRPCLILVFNLNSKFIRNYDILSRTFILFLEQNHELYTKWKCKLNIFRPWPNTFTWEHIIHWYIARKSMNIYSKISHLHLYVASLYDEIALFRPLVNLLWRLVLCDSFFFCIQYTFYRVMRVQSACSGLALTHRLYIQLSSMK